MPLAKPNLVRTLDALALPALPAPFTGVRRKVVPTSALVLLMCLPIFVACSDAASDAVSDQALSLKAPKTPPVSQVVDPARELMITDLSVVEDPVRTVYPATTPGQPRRPNAGAWTFGGLAEQMANSTDRAVVSSFVLHWLRQWSADQSINGFTAPARPAMKTMVIDPWLAKSGGKTLDMAKAPFRLLAISNRIDLRSSTMTGDGASMTAGEGRFVFGVLDDAGNALPFTVIFEYGVSARLDRDEPIATGQDVQAWANAWHKLGSIPFGPAYNTALQAITTRFTRPVCSWNPRGSCLNQLRTNEVPLSPLGLDPNGRNGQLWELRDFRLSRATNELEGSPMSQVPDVSFNNSAALADLLSANEDAVRGGTFTLPSSILAASDPAPFGRAWEVPGVPSDVRFGFASNTCSGCHTTETGTFFLHVVPRLPGEAARLSGFLTGTTANDPVSGEPRTFNALADRGAGLLALINMQGADVPRERRNNRVH